MKNKTTYIFVDTSGSMRDCNTHSRASTVNQALREVVTEVLPRVLAEKDAELDPSIAILTFSSYGIVWHIPKTRMEELSGEWLPIDMDRFNGGTPTGEAIKVAIDDINNGCYGEPDPDAVAPAFLLISDGMPNGTNPTYEEVLDYAERSNPNFCAPFRYSNRIAIGIQVDQDGRESLMKFGRTSASISAKGYQPYYDCGDDNKEALIEIIKSCTLGLSVGM